MGMIAIVERGMRRLILSIGVAITAVAIIASLHVPVRAAHGDHVVIAEVQVGGASARDEFIELYNPTAVPIALEGWRLAKRTASGSETNLVTNFPAIAIPSHGSLLIAHPEGAFAGAADIRYTTGESIAANNALVLYGPAASGSRPTVDLIGWGTASGEGTAAPNPPPGQSLDRKPGGAEGNGQDTNDNATDVLLREHPMPQSVAAVPRPLLDAALSRNVSTDAAPATSAVSGTTTSGAAVSGTAPAAPLDPATMNASSGSSGVASSQPSGGSTSRMPAVTTTGSTPTLPTHIRINEFVADPAEGDEWIELVNTGSSPVVLTDWVIEDGAETRTVLSGAIGIGDARFLIIAKPKGQLNNNGDRIILRQPGGRVVDAVTYGDWDDGRRSDNAPTASDPASVARIVDGVDTDHDRTDFARTEVPTPGAPNVVSTMPTAEGRATSGRASAPVSPRIILSELLPNPPGGDTEEEIIELANTGTEGGDVSGWRIRDALGAEYAIAASDGPTAIPAGGFLALTRRRTGIALNNTGGETVRLLAPDAERATSVAEYTGAVAEGVAWARAADGTWSWTERPTPGSANVVAPPNRPPDAVIDGPRELEFGAIVAFDGSDSADPDRETIAYAWDFGDPRTEADNAQGAIGRYAYDRPGTYDVRLTVTDARGLRTSDVHRIRVRPREVAAGEANDGVPKTVGGGDMLTGVPIALVAPAVPTTLRLSELIPNPVGSDNEEWVEVENTGAVALSLAGWSIGVAAADTPREGERSRSPRRASLPSEFTLAPGVRLVVHRAALHLPLRNDGAIVTLYAPDGTSIDRVTYGTAREGESFARRDAHHWEWTATPTPGGPNVFPDRRETPGEEPAIGMAEQPQRSAARSLRASVTLASLADLAEHEVGDHITVRGVVTAPPKTIGSQVFYVADSDGGVQVFVGKRAIAPLALGDRIEVTGELREVGGERRIGLQRVEDVRITGHGAPLTPEPLRVAEVTPERVGTLVAIAGEVVEIRGRTVAVDDGSDELRITLPSSGVDAGEAIASGDTIRVIGVLSRSRGGFRVLARSAADVTAVARVRTAPPVRPTASPLRTDVELALLGGGSALVAASLWSRRRMLALAFRGMHRLVAFARWV